MEKGAGQVVSVLEAALEKIHRPQARVEGVDVPVHGRPSFLTRAQKPTS
jgi:hypothetical protein